MVPDDTAQHRSALVQPGSCSRLVSHHSPSPDWSLLGSPSTYRLNPCHVVIRLPMLQQLLAALIVGGGIQRLGHSVTTVRTSRTIIRRICGGEEELFN